jgi:hypothetical protein
LRRIEKPPPQAGDLANVFVPESAPQYRHMVEMAGKPNANPREFKFVPGGISVGLAWFDGPAKIEKHFKVPTDDELRALYPTLEAQMEQADG